MPAMNAWPDDAPASPSRSAKAPAAFQGTRWSVVLGARDPDSRVAQKALAELCQMYWYPLYAFVRRSGHEHHEAEDLTQGFFQHLLGKNGLAHVDPARGRFRSFLLAALKHFLAHQRERAAAQKRGGGQPLESLDLSGAEERYAAPPASPATPEALYDRGWALTLLDAVLRELREEYGGKGKATLFDALQPHLTGADDGASYAETAARLNMTEGNVKISVHRLRRRLGLLLRSQVAQTVQSETDIDEEIRYLMACVGQ